MIIKTFLYIDPESGDIYIDKQSKPLLKDYPMTKHITALIPPIDLWNSRQSRNKLHGKTTKATNPGGGLK